MNRSLSPKIFALCMLLIFILGILGIFYFNSLLNPASDKVGLLLSPVTNQPITLTLNLTNPDDNLLVTDPNLLISGKTSPNATVIISSDSKDQNLQASKDGDFSTTLKLDGGVNNFMVAVFDDAGNSKQEARTIYYSQEKI